MKLIYLSPVPWHSFSQRPHELARFFHDTTGGDVLWIDPYPTRFPTISDLKSSRASQSKAFNESVTWLTILRPSSIPIEPLPLSRHINKFFWKDIFKKISNFVDTSTVIGIGKPSALAVAVLSKTKAHYSFYDAMDDFPAFYTGMSRQSMRSHEAEIVHMANSILVSSVPLREKFSAWKGKTSLVHNACAIDRIDGLGNRCFPKSSEKTFGYIGTIASWFDWKILDLLARSCPEDKFRIIGPLHCDCPKDLSKNILIENPVSHDDALKIMAEIDVGLIPFKKNQLTASVDPIKYYEYRALGTPIISTSFGEMAFRASEAGVYLIDETSDFRTVGREALAFNYTPEQIDLFREKNSWSKRFSAISFEKHSSDQSMARGL